MMTEKDHYFFGLDPRPISCELIGATGGFGFLPTPTIGTAIG